MLFHNRPKYTLVTALLMACTAYASSATTDDTEAAQVATPPTVSTASPATANATDFIEIFAALSGAHPGVRKGHARGVCAAGRFLPDEEATKRFTSPLFAAEAPVIIRFSMAGGNPQADERALSPRGMAVQIQLPDGQVHQLAGLSTPLFAGKNPEQFLGLLRINHLIQTGAATPEDRERYLAANPEAARQGAWVRARAPAAAYTRDSYYGIHTFHAAQADGTIQPFRWQLVPGEGEMRLTESEREALPAAFLEERLAQTLSEQGEAWFEWRWILGQPGDTTSDPSQLWPDEREAVTVGRLQLTEASGSTCDPVNFDPNRLASGVNPGDDPVLALRSAAYAISQGKRLANQ
ncbi:MAG: catalase family peroxidase [Halieaceae bacterium]|uniref:catalase family peroxidase n=1 Tax=Haliea alexandrii TaxID=2448162 RepID=UPI001304DAFA|nr:catalase family peroxidase [Haliea alexandrii]MCR9185295.1 catalase family peroxidase [Halieaceae bacterium]